MSPQTPNAKFQLVTPKQASYLLPIHPSRIECHTDSNTIIEKIPTHRRDNYSAAIWFATPENCNDSSKLNGIRKTIFNTIKRFKQLELLDPTINEENRNQLLEKKSIG